MSDRYTVELDSSAELRFSNSSDAKVEGVSSDNSWWKIYDNELEHWLPEWFSYNRKDEAEARCEELNKEPDPK